MARPKKARDNATSPRAIAVAEKRAEALEYRKQGYSYAQIAEAMDVSRTHAFQLVDAAIKEIVREPGEMVQDLELARLDDLTVAVMKSALAGDVMALDRVLKIAERRAAMLGIDAPTRSELTGKGGGAMVVQINGTDSNL